MDLYILGADFQRLETLDNFSSLVWTERYQAYGDFRLDIQSSTYVKNNLKFWKYLETSTSRQPMMLERVERDNQLLESDLIKCSGRGLAAIFKHRNTKNQALKDAAIFSGQASKIMRDLVYRYAVDSTLAGPVNVLPGLTANDTGIGPTIRVALERGALYDNIQTVAVLSGLGFILMRESDGTLFFQAVDGVDRTVPGSLYHEYSTDGESLMNPNSFESIEGYKNHARVLGKKTGVDVYGDGVSSTISGWDRRTMVVDAEDIGTPADYEQGEGDPPPTTIAEDQDDLRQRGKAELRKQANRYQRLIGGDIPTHNWNATYYGLGDIVWVKDNNGIKSKMRISEQIWSLDQTGEVRTPTFEEYYTP